MEFVDLERSGPEESEFLSSIFLCVIVGNNLYL